MTLTVSELDEYEQQFNRIEPHSETVTMSLSEARAFLLTARRSIAPWEPISSAPKDGTEFLSFSEDSRIQQSYWSDAIKRFYPIAYPTHWMPLPPPPSMASEERKEDDTGSGTQNRDRDSEIDRATDRSSTIPGDGLGAGIDGRASGQVAPPPLECEKLDADAFDPAWCKTHNRPWRVCSEPVVPPPSMVVPKGEPTPGIKSEPSGHGGNYGLEPQSEERKEDGVATSDFDICDGAPTSDVPPPPVVPPPLESGETGVYRDPGCEWVEKTCKSCGVQFLSDKRLNLIRCIKCEPPTSELLRDNQITQHSDVSRNNDVAGLCERLRKPRRHPKEESSYPHQSIRHEAADMLQRQREDLEAARNTIKAFTVSATAQLAEKEREIERLKASDTIGRKLLAGRDKQITTLTAQLAEKEREIEEEVFRRWRLESTLTAQLEAYRGALEKVREAIIEHAPDTLWVGLIETAVDHIDAVLKG